MTRSLLPLQQHPHFAACLRAAKLEVLETTAGVILLRRVAGLPVSLASRGTEALMDQLSERPGQRLFTGDHPDDTALRRNGYVPLVPAATLAEWDITPSPARLHAQMSQSWRNQLCRAEVAPVRICKSPAPQTLAHRLFQTDSANARAKRYKPLPHWLSVAWAQLHPRDILLLEARSNGVPIAAMLFLRHGLVATYQIATGSQTARQFNTHRAMLWQAALHFRNRGVARLDLGVISSERHPGLARFKLGTGARSRELGRTWGALPGLSQSLRHLRFHFPFGQKA